MAAFTDADRGLFIAAPFTSPHEGTRSLVGEMTAAAWP
jgi:hypothetical protein